MFSGMPLSRRWGYYRGVLSIPAIETFMEEKRRQLEQELKKEEPFFKKYESKKEKQEQETKDHIEKKDEKK